MTTPRTNDSAFESFRAKLAEMFMFDQADLDFGIYRIMNAKRTEISKFLEDELPRQVEKYVNESVTHNRFTYESLIATATHQQNENRVRYLRERLDNLSADQLANDVYTHLNTFFSRYYDKGDFISLRRINKEAYAIPYNGEEVKLHWANADQYYIKSSEYFRDYTFTLSDGRQVHFKLIDADTETNNNKANANAERRFVLCGDAPVQQSADGRTLTITFTYQVHSEKQDKLNEITLQRVETQLNSTQLNSTQLNSTQLNRIIVA